MPRTGEAHVLGRDGELEVLTGLARDAASGRGRLVLIEGEPGIGKTSLLGAFLADAAGPVAVAVDDLHWADPASVLLLHRLGRVAGQLPLLLVAARRSGAGAPDTEALARAWLGHGAAQIALGPLPDAAVDRLVADLAGGRPGPALRGLVSGAAGNPLYIQELVSGLAQGMRLRSAGQEIDVDASNDHLGVSPTLRAAIARR